VTTEAPTVSPDLRAATRGVYIAFIGAGAGVSSWLSRIPQVRDELDLTPAALGVLLLMIAIGSLIALPLAGWIVHRLGAGRAVFFLSMVFAAGISIAAIGVMVGAPMVAAGLVAAGFGTGTWDVAMNVEAAAVEQRLGRSVMSRFHAAFSVGTVAGAAIGAGMNALDVSVTIHLLVVMAVVAVVVPWGARSFLPSTGQEQAGDATNRSPFAAWKEPRTLLIGLFVLTMAFTEGTGNDWLGVAAIDGYGASDTVGGLAYVLFVASMTVGRWFGPGVLDRHGRVLVLRAGAACSLVGLAIVVFGPSLITAMVGTVLWGLGVALGFPVGMSAAADDERHAAGRVSVVATIGYVAFLAGPALVGLIGNHVGVLRALTVTGGMLAVGLLLAGVTRPLVVEHSDPPA
jgi:predicted MFS family arabinose efflux permease